MDLRPEKPAHLLGAPDSLLLGAFEAALSAVAPEKTVPPALPEPPRGRTVVVGAGKASAAMARAVERRWQGGLSGLVVVPRGYGVECERIEVVEAAHPVPDEVGFAAAGRILKLVSDLGPEDLVIALFSGGGSALLPLPAGAVSMEDKRSLITQLLRAGANIGEINCLRKHLSAIKGGRLACAAYPAAVVNILISDVAGDDPATIASGPAVPDPSTLADARQVVEKYRLLASPGVLAHLEQTENETPKPDDPCFARVSTRIVASARTLLEAAAAFLEERGVPSLILGDSIEGESRDVALVHAAIARQVAQRGQPIPAPCALLSGGETTVTIRGDGRGGSNMEFLLALVSALKDSVSYAAIACDTDGSDGSSGIAGAVARSDSWRRAEGLGLDPRRMLDNNDSCTFFAALGDLVDTGPTFNNVNDLRALLVLASEECDSAR
jgi:glycerate 2-kinase